MHPAEEDAISVGDGAEPEAVASGLLEGEESARGDL
jgi:hypothetical protein